MTPDWFTVYLVGTFAFSIGIVVGGHASEWGHDAAQRDIDRIHKEVCTAMSDIEDTVARRKATIESDGKVSWDDEAKQRISKALEDETEWRRQLDDDLCGIAQSILYLNQKFDLNNGSIINEMKQILERRAHARAATGDVRS